MKCAICQNGQTESGHTTVTLERGETTLVFKRVPAQICNNCGEEYIPTDTTEALLKLAEEACKRGVFLEMLNFAA